ncbi:WD domain containing protein [Entamoeba histolytica KU27]|uniref:WD domain containing protein n=1 Tax=Entamoeba histolytica KU27 TaxID=885311 RepID=M2RW99_ENTHI|nr:WD domain containing protein [Entamoeba histolytica KU27]
MSRFANVFNVSFGSNKEKKNSQRIKTLSENNKGAIDWNYGVMAFGSRTNVIVMDSFSFIIINVLNHHIEDITAIKFQDNYPFEIPYSKRNVQLISGDAAGNIILWDYFNNTPLISYSNVSNTPVKCLRWHKNASNIFISLFGNGTIIFYDSITGQAVKYIESNSIINPISFEQSPFDPDEICVCTMYEVFLISTKQMTVYEIYTCPSNIKSGDITIIKSIYYSKTPQKLLLLTSSELVIFDTVLTNTIGSILLTQSPSIFSFSLDESKVNIFNTEGYVEQYQINVDELFIDKITTTTNTPKKLPPIFHLIRNPINNDICIQLQNGSISILRDDGSDFNITFSDCSFSCQATVLVPYNQTSLCIGTETGETYLMDVDNQKLTNMKAPNIACPIRGITCLNESIILYGVEKRNKSEYSPGFNENRIMRFPEKKERGCSYLSSLTTSKEEIRKVIISSNGLVSVFVYTSKIQFWENKSDSYKLEPIHINIQVHCIVPIKNKINECSFLCTSDKDILIIRYNKGKATSEKIYTHSSKIRVLSNFSEKLYIFVDSKNIIYNVEINQLQNNKVNEFDKRSPVHEKIINIIPCPKEETKKIGIITQNQNCFIYDYSTGRLNNDFNVFLQQRRIKVIDMCWVKGDIPVVLTHAKQVMIYSPDEEKVEMKDNSQTTPLHLLPSKIFRKVMSIMLHGFTEETILSNIINKYHMNIDFITNENDKQKLCEGTWIKTNTMKNEYNEYITIINKTEITLIEQYIKITELLKYPQLNEFWKLTNKCIQQAKQRDSNEQYQNIIRQNNKLFLNDSIKVNKRIVPQIKDVVPPPYGLYPELFVDTKLIDETEKLRLEKYEIAIQEDEEINDVEKSCKLNELELVFGTDCSMIGKYIDMLKKTQKIEYGLCATLFASTTHPELLENTINDVIDELLNIRHEEEAIHLLENIGNYQSACQLMIQTGKVFQAAYASTTLLPLDKTVPSIYIPYVVQQLGKGYYIPAAINLMKVGGFIDAIRILLKGNYIELSALLLNVLLAENMVNLDEQIEVNLKTIIFQSPINVTTFRELCRVVYEKYISILLNNLEIPSLAEFYSIRLRLLD